MIWLWLVLAAVLGAVVAAGVLHAAAERDRRGGLLELDTPRARGALRRRDGYRVERAHTRMVGRCGHLIGLGFDYVIRDSDGTKWCSPACSQVKPFAGGDGA